MKSIRLSKKLLAIPATLLALSLCGTAFAETITTKDNVKSLSVAIYNNGTGLVKDTRSVPLSQGINTVSFAGISARIQSETALITGSGISVMEQNFNFDLLSRNSLLQKYLGKEIQVIKTNPATGAEKTETAKVLSVDKGLILKIGNRIETDYGGRLVFPDIPKNLREKPTLTMDINAKSAGKQDLQLTYLTSGLTWKADYVAKLNKYENQIDLSGWVTLTNTSGADYENADLQFIAGEVNRARPHAVRNVMMAKSAQAMDYVEEAGGMEEEALMDYHLYSLGRKSTILSNQTKQLALLSAYSVPAKKEYRFDNLINAYGYGNKSFKNRSAAVKLTFVNDKKSNMGLPIPSGIVRVYKADSKERIFFVGEDNVSHTPENEKITLKLGEAFDVTSEGKETKRVANGKNSWEASYEIIFKNATDNPVVVEYYQYFPHNWSIIGTDKGTRDNSSQNKWSIKIPVKGKTVLTYTVKVKGPEK